MEYIEFKRKDLGWEDDKGNSLSSIEGRKNQPGIDAFRHRGYDYPDIIYDKKCKGWISDGNQIIIKLDLTQEEAEQLIIKEKDKKAKKPDVNDKLYKKLLKINEPIESGVTQ